MPSPYKVLVPSSLRLVLQPLRLARRQPKAQDCEHEPCWRLLEAVGCHLIGLVWRGSLSVRSPQL